MNTTKRPLPDHYYQAYENLKAINDFRKIATEGVLKVTITEVFNDNLRKTERLELCVEAKGIDLSNIDWSDPKFDDTDERRAAQRLSRITHYFGINEHGYKQNSRLIQKIRSEWGFKGEIEYFGERIRKIAGTIPAGKTFGRQFEHY